MFASPISHNSSRESSKLEKTFANRPAKLQKIPNPFTETPPLIHTALPNVFRHNDRRRIILDSDQEREESERSRISQDPENPIELWKHKMKQVAQDSKRLQKSKQEFTIYNKQLDGKLAGQLIQQVQPISSRTNVPINLSIPPPSINRSQVNPPLTNPKKQTKTENIVPAVPNILIQEEISPRQALPPSVLLQQVRLSHSIITNQGLQQTPFPNIFQPKNDGLNRTSHDKTSHEEDHLAGSSLTDRIVDRINQWKSPHDQLNVSSPSREKYNPYSSQNIGGASPARQSRIQDECNFGKIRIKGYNYFNSYLPSGRAYFDANSIPHFETTSPFESKVPPAQCIEDPQKKQARRKRVNIFSGSLHQSVREQRSHSPINEFKIEEDCPHIKALGVLDQIVSSMNGAHHHTEGKILPAQQAIASLHSLNIETSLFIQRMNQSQSLDELSERSREGQFTDTLIRCRRTVLSLSSLCTEPLPQRYHMTSMAQAHQEQYRLLQNYNAVEVIEKVLEQYEFIKEQSAHLMEALKYALVYIETKNVSEMNSMIGRLVETIRRLEETSFSLGTSKVESMLQGYILREVALLKDVFANIHKR